MAGLHVDHSARGLSRARVARRCRWLQILTLCAPLAAPGAPAAGEETAEEAFRKASGKGLTTERIFREARNVVRAWLA